MPIIRQADQVAEAWLRARLAGLQPGDELYLAPQLRIVLGRREALVNTYALATRLGLAPGSGANRWRTVEPPVE